MISHDRYFLDKTISRVIEIKEGKAEFYAGNYSFYAVEKQRRYLEQLRQYKKEQAEIQRLTETARMMHQHNTEHLNKRAFSIEKRIAKMNRTARPEQQRKMKAKFGQTEFLADDLLTLRELKKSFGERTLFDHVSLRVEPGDRIALLGDNGTGKSTLLKILLGEEAADSGAVKQGITLKTGYLPQQIRFAHPERSLHDTMLYEANCSAQQARDRLGKFLFQGEDVFKPVSVLSGGEQSRLRLCMLMDEKVNFLILDEPTNHLDLDSREWIEEAVEAFDGTLLFVSHDRYFINRFATRVWELAEGTINDYPMGFAQYRAAKAEEKKPAPAPVQKKKQDTRPPRAGREKQAARRQLTICETGISKLEERCRQLDAEMEQNACDAEKLQELFREKQDLEAQLEQEMARWEELSLQLEE